MIIAEREREREGGLHQPAPLKSVSGQPWTTHNFFSYRIKTGYDSTYH